MKRSYGWLLCSLIFFGILIAVTIKFTRDYKIYTRGEIVNVVITKIPKMGGTKSVGLLWVMFNGKEYSVTVRGPNGGDFKKDEQIQFRYLEENTKQFIFPNDNPIPWGIACISILSFFGLCSLYYFFKK